MSHTLTDEVPWSQPTDPDLELGKVYRENVDYVWRALVHLGVQSCDVADVAHDVFVVVGRKIAGFERRSSLRTWIYGICIRTVSDYRNRAFRRREQASEELPEGAVSSTQEQQVESAVLNQRLQRLLELLSEDQRAVFVLFEIEGLGMKEVAQALDCPVQTAYSRLHAARDLLKAELSRLGYEP